jgi:predicted ATPase/DNA-binding winged helix-turn-helix (wHTH) protein
MSYHPEVDMDTRTFPSADFSFGATVVVPARRELLHNGKRVDVGDRAFDLLLFLVESRGYVASKDEIISHVWPGRIVEENTVEGQVSALRRALGCDRTAIRTVTGRGYQFTGEIAGSGSLPLPSESACRTGVPIPADIGPIVGRADALKDVCDIALKHRLMTLAGAGGIGKTRLAFEAARRLTSHFPDGVCLAELAATASADYLPSTVAVALGFPPGDGTTSLDRLAPVLSAKKVLLVLDNCEHLIEGAAQICERLLRIAPGATVLATSREPLRISGEFIYRVPSLDVPSDENVDDAREFGAIQLFEERAGLDIPSRDHRHALPFVVRICRQLDGIPLAIELAAACATTLGLQGIADRLDDRFQLLTRGARTALPRQQTLRATLDWSYSLLSDTQRMVVNRLSLFSGAFSMESAQALAATDDVKSDAVLSALVELVDKSLVSAVSTNGNIRYRLLETTRAYAREKLREEGAWSAWCRRHADYVLDIFKEAESQASARIDVDWNNRYAPHLEDLRAAVKWSFSDDGDPELAIDLTVASIPLSMQLALLEECLARVDQALQRLADSAATAGEREMKLYAARGMCLLCHTVATQTSEAFDSVIALAKSMSNDAYQLLGMWGRWMCFYLNGQFSEMSPLAQAFEAVAKRSAWTCDKLAAHRVSGMSHLLRGDLDQALHHLDRAANSSVRLPRAQRMRFLYDERMLSHASLSHTLWFMGRIDQARAAAQRSLDDAREFDHPVSICYALSEAICTMAILTGDDAGLADAVAEMVIQTRRHSIATWRARAQMWQGFLELRLGNSSAYSQIIYPAITRIGSKRFYVSLTPFVTATAELLASHGKLAQALDLIVPSAERAIATRDECSLPELLRAKAELVRADQGAVADSMVESMLRDALARAASRGFLSWQLRCATSLASLLKQRGTEHSAHDLIDPLYGQFSEGFSSRDLKAAQAALSEGS